MQTLTISRERLVHDISTYDNGTIGRLPRDVLRYILPYCPDESVTNVYATCKRWYHAEDRTMCLADMFFNIPDRISLIRKTPHHFVAASKQKEIVEDEEDLLLSSVQILFYPTLFKLDASKYKNMTDVKVVMCGPYTTNEDVQNMTQNLTGLVRLDLSKCALISDVGLSHMHTLTGLQTLDLSGCAKVTNKSLEYLSCVPSLTDLNLSTCVDVTDDGMQHVGKLAMLRTLNVNGCEGVSDASLRDLSQLTSLTDLNLSKCGMNGSGFPHLTANLKQLATLKLNCC
eukprot:PhF_6_TR23743/c0_g1_i2/m.33163